MLSQFTAPKTKPKPKGAPNDATKATPKAGESACTLGMIRGGVLDQRQDFATQIKHRSNMYSAEVTNIFIHLFRHFSVGLALGMCCFVVHGFGIPGFFFPLIRWRRRIRNRNFRGWGLGIS